MQTENILQAVFRGLGDSIKESFKQASVSQEEILLSESGLHYSDPDRLVNCPLLNATGSPVLILEGFRNGRFVSSALFNERGYEIITSIECSLPPISCLVKQGVPRIIKSPVALPIDLIGKMEDAVIASDGKSIFSRRICRSGNAKALLNAQISEIKALETLIARM